MENWLRKEKLKAIFPHTVAHNEKVAKILQLP